MIRKPWLYDIRWDLAWWGMLHTFNFLMYVVYECVNFLFLICQIVIYVVYKYAKSSLVCQVYEYAKFYICSINPKIMNDHVNIDNMIMSLSIIWSHYDHDNINHMNMSISHSHVKHNIRIHTCTSLGRMCQKFFVGSLTGLKP